MVQGRYGKWTARMTMALMACLVGWSGACDDQQDEAVYVTLSLEEPARTELGNSGHVALTFVAGQDKAGCGPKWALNPNAWGAEENCKDEWKTIEDVGSSYTWKIDANSEYSWVLVLIELFDSNGVAHFRAYRTMRFGGGEEWNVTVRQGDLCPSVRAGECCSDGHSGLCKQEDSLTGWNPDDWDDVTWCVESQAHDSCRAPVTQR